MKYSINVCFIIVCLLLSVKGFSHEIKPAKLSITQVKKHKYNIKWIVPLTDSKKLKITPQFPNGFKLKQSNEILLNNAHIVTYIGTYNESLKGKTVTILQLENSVIDVLILYKSLENKTTSYLLNPTQTSYTFKADVGFFANAWAYIILGLEHILEGIDHLLFVLSLLLISGSKINLLKTITGFTIGHSITLIISTLGWFTLSSNPIEILILLSIIFMAYEIVKSKDKAYLTTTTKHTWGIAFIFGLIHGFGFSGALKEIGIPDDQLISSLLFFNVGVEAGQLVFIITVLIFSFIIKKLILNIYNFINEKKMLAYGIGSYACFLFLKILLG
jgi:hydrogenase/urease accessory protein HupE